MNHRLFEIDILASLHRIDCSLLVPMVRRGDQDGIDVVPGKDLTVIASREEIGAPQLFGVGKAAIVAVGHGDQLHAGNLQRGASVPLALDAGADQCELDDVIGRFRLWRR